MQAGAERKKKRRSSLSTDLGHANPTCLHGDGAGLGGPLEAREPGHWLPLLSKARHSLATERAPEMGPGQGRVQFSLLLVLNWVSCPTYTLQTQVPFKCKAGLRCPWQNGKNQRDQGLNSDLLLADWVMGQVISPF